MFVKPLPLQSFSDEISASPNSDIGVKVERVSVKSFHFFFCEKLNKLYFLSKLYIILLINFRNYKELGVFLVEVD